MRWTKPTHYSRLANKSECVETLHHAIKLALAAQDSANIKKLHTLAAIILEQLGDFPAAVEHYKHLRNVVEATENSQHHSDKQSKLGSCKSHLCISLKCLILFVNSNAVVRLNLSICIVSLKTHIYTQMGEWYQKMREYKKSIKAYKKLLEVAWSHNDRNTEIKAYDLIGIQ